MPTLTVTAKGQVTLKRELLEHLGVRPGDKVEFTMMPDGEVRLGRERPSQCISEVFGILKRSGQRAMAIDEINDVIADGWAGIER